MIEVAHHGGDLFCRQSLRLLRLDRHCCEHRDLCYVWTEFHGRWTLPLHSDHRHGTEDCHENSRHLCF